MRGLQVRVKMVTINLSRQNSYGDSVESNSVDFLVGVLTCHLSSSKVL